MKKSLNKVIVTLAAVAALAMGTTAMAAVTTETVSVENGTAKFEVTSTATTVGEQVTLLMLKSTADVTDGGITADEIAYIDQDAAKEVTLEDGSTIVAAVFPNVNIKLSAEEVAKYDAGETIELAVMSGNETGTLAEGEGVIGETTEESAGILGDVSNADGVDLVDASLIVQAFIGNGYEISKEKDIKEYYRADTTKADGVDLVDASLIVQNFLGNYDADGDVGSEVFVPAE